jgi:hypothetical protein
MDWETLLKKFEYIGKKNDSDYEKTMNLMRVIKNFIIRKELIIYGGIAIDYALRLKGSKLYEREQLHPDYDVYSPNYLEDCKKIVDELTIMGFKNVSAIRGMHILTMRIRCDHIYLLDISYVPESIFKKIPILKYNRFTFADPIFQMIDMHKSLCFPYLNTPLESIMNRGKKDVIRYNILAKHYPPSSYIKKVIKLVNNRTANPKFYNGSGGKKNTKEKNTKEKSKKRLKQDIRLNTFVKLETDLTVLPPFVVGIGEESDGKLAITGFGGYAILRKCLDDLASLLNIKIKITAPRLDFSFSENYEKFILDAPDIGNNNINFLTYSYMAVVEDLSKKGIEFERYRAYLDYDYEYIKFNNTTISSTEKQLIAASFHHIGNDKYIYITSVQHILLYFLFRYNITNYTVYLEYYIHTLNILSAAEMIFKSLIDKVKESEIELIHIFNKSLFAPIISTFGDLNVCTSYIIQEGKKILQVGDDIDSIPEILGIKDTNFSDIIEDLPKNIYPFSKLQLLDKSVIYNQDGRKCPTNIKEKYFD